MSFPPVSVHAPSRSPDQIVRDTLEGILQAAQQALGADRVTCYVHEHGREVVSAAHTTETDPRRRAFLQEAVGKGIAELPIWRAHLSSASPIFTVEDASADDELPPLLASRLGSGAFLGVRLEHHSVGEDGKPRLLGSLFCSYRRPRSFGEAERSIATGLANLASLALANAHLHAQTLASLAAAERRAETDALTGLANRHGIERRLEAEVASAQESGRRLAAVAIDLDDFKAVNDRHGHEVGDECLSLVARTIESDLRPGDVAGRVGGEEFFVLLPGTGSRGAWLVAERLRNHIRGLPAPGHTRLSASFGIAAVPRHAQSSGELFRAADAAMYEAKAGGRDRSMVHSSARARERSEGSRRAQAGREAYLASVLALGSALDARDARTHSHSATVARYAAAIAEHLGMDGDRIDDIRIAGLLHDIGKVAASDAVLEKPGALTPAEHAEMRRHPVIGARLLTHPDLREVRTWVLRHHERPDGLGYPGGLSGGEIPREALILGVADAYEAMTADRSYRRALPPQVARDELVAGRGTQFDAEVVDAFLMCLAEGVDRALPPALTLAQSAEEAFNRELSRG